MRVFLLGAQAARLASVVQGTGDEVILRTDPLRVEDVVAENAEFVISYGFRHIIRVDVLARLPQRVINLHISYLPWNRGADPNLWSFLEDTAKGVTIHFVDKGLDTGPVIAQESVEVMPHDTLATTYSRLSERVERLFAVEWPAIRERRRTGRPQRGAGSFHRVSDREPYAELLTHGWETPVAALVGAAKRRV